MADLHTFWNELDALPTEETPLTAAESDRLADAVLAKVHAESGEAPRKKSVHRAKSAKRRRVPVWGRALAGVTACMAVLCGVNTVNRWPRVCPLWGMCSVSSTSMTAKTN